MSGRLLANPGLALADDAAKDTAGEAHLIAIDRGLALVLLVFVEVGQRTFVTVAGAGHRPCLFAGMLAALNDGAKSIATRRKLDDCAG